MPYTALQGMLDGGAPPRLRNYFRGGFVSDLSDEVIAVLLEHAARMPGPMSQLHMHQMGGAVGRVGTRTSSFSGRAAGYTYNVIGTWMDPAEDSAYIASVRATSAALAPLSLTSSYVNFEAETDAGATRAAYGTEIYGRLSRLKAALDPGNLFDRNQNVQPAP
jgi:hypothetical protein